MGAVGIPCPGPADRCDVDFSPDLVVGPVGQVFNNPWFNCWNRSVWVGDRDICPFLSAGRSNPHLAGLTAGCMGGSGVDAILDIVSGGIIDGLEIQEIA